VRRDAVARTWSPAVPGRQPYLVAKQAKLLSLWCVTGTDCPLLMCNMHRAAAIVKRKLLAANPGDPDIKATVRSTQLTPTQRDAWRLWCTILARFVTP
jgi:hypothetical protein